MTTYEVSFDITVEGNVNTATAIARGLFNRGQVPPHLIVEPVDEESFSQAPSAYANFLFEQEVKTINRRIDGLQGRMESLSIRLATLTERCERVATFESKKRRELRDETDVRLRAMTDSAIEGDRESVEYTDVIDARLDAVLQLLGITLCDGESPVHPDAPHFDAYFGDPDVTDEADIQDLNDLFPPQSSLWQPDESFQ